MKEKLTEKSSPPKRGAATLPSPTANSASPYSAEHQCITNSYDSIVIATRLSITNGNDTTCMHTIMIPVF